MPRARRKVTFDFFVVQTALPPYRFGGTEKGDRYGEEAWRDSRRFKTQEKAEEWYRTLRDRGCLVGNLRIVHRTTTTLEETIYP